MTLHAQILDAHANADAESLVTLYTKAADAAEDIDRACFFLTHAFIFALEAGDTRAPVLRARLVAHGRETPD